ncbi:MAG: response regulator [Candidatus Eisenbacteria bacterium]
MRPRVLFVDDDVDLLATTRLGLSTEHYDVLTATSAEEALRLLAREEVAIVVSDDRMPGMRGADFLSVVAERHPTITTMLLTGFGDLDTAMRAINEARVHRFLLKPCFLPELKQILRDALQLRSLAGASTRLLEVARREQAARRELEAENPGITEVTRTDDGAFVIDDETAPTAAAEPTMPRSVDSLIDEIEEVVDRLRRHNAA